MKTYIVIAAFFATLSTVNAQNQNNTPSTDTAKMVFKDHLEGRLGLGGGLSSFVTQNSQGLESEMGWMPVLDLTGHYFFNKNWGVGLGVGLSNYKLNTSYSKGMSIQNMVDIDGDVYTLHTDVGGNAAIEESHAILNVDIPVMATYRFPINHKLKLSTSVGVKFGIPVSEKSTLKNNASSFNLSTTGEYLQYGQPSFENVYMYGFYENAPITSYASHDSYNNWENVTTSLVLDMAVIMPLKNQMDLMVGGYFTYGVTDYTPNKRETKLINDDMSYNGSLLGVKTARPIQAGVKVSLAFGKASNSRMVEPLPESSDYLKKSAEADSLAKALNTQDSLIAILVNQQEHMAVKLAATEEIVERANKEMEEEQQKLLVKSMIDNSPIYFEKQSSELTAADKEELKAIYEQLKAHDLQVAIIGFTDENGSKKANKVLSEKRAQSVYDYLITLGMSPSRVVSIGKGESDLAVQNAKTDEEHRLNRRVVIQVEL